jgi:aldehyde:ferredoxin oxidoreductase
VTKSSNILGSTWGKIAHVNLSTRKTSYEAFDPELMRLLVGGRALSTYLLLRDLPPNVDPLGADNLFIIAPGILQGTNLPGTGRLGFAGKSPLTGALGSSEAGGFFGHEVKWTGLDAIVVSGRADTPVYLWVTGGEVEIRAADQLWGLETKEVQQLLRDQLGDDKVKVAAIGPAGENLVRYAAIMTDVNRAAGRTGLGAVMGSKHLKAVAVRGTQAVRVADRPGLIKLAKWLGGNYKQEVGWAVRMGTVSGVRNLNKVGALPTKAFTEPQFDKVEQISGHLMHETILVGRDTCQACPIRCKQVVANDDPTGTYQIDPTYGGPEYETIAALGSCCRVEELLAVVKANERCAAYGLDTISTGVVIAFVMECVEKGLLTAEMTGGYLPVWGDSAGLLRGVEMIAHVEGFGAAMAGGVARLSAQIGGGSEAFALHVKGQELPMHEPRLKAGMGLGYAVAPVGADHMMNFDDTSYTTPDSLVMRAASVYKSGPLSPSELSEDKLNVFVHEVNFAHFLDSAVVCMFYPYNYEQMAEVLTAATGVPYSVRDILAVGERAQVLARIFNYREGFTAADDKLPGRVMKPFADGPLAGIEITPERLQWAIHRYYELMGWDAESGRPSPEKISELGMAPLMDHLGS